MTNEGSETLSRVRETSYFAVLLATLIAIRPWRKPDCVLLLPWPHVIALCWCALSLTWALEPGVGLRRLVLTAIVLWSLFALTRQLGLTRSVAIVRVMLIALLVVNYVAVLAYPAIGIDRSLEPGLTNTWRGIMSQKNFAGITCAMTVLLFAFDAASIRLPLRITAIAAAGVFLFFTDSSTSIGMCIAALALGLLLTWRMTRAGALRILNPNWAWLLLGIIAALFAHMALNPSVYLNQLADPGGFTGRTQIWSALVRAYAYRPWLGIGYGSFWDLGPEGPITAYAIGWVTTVSQGHNGYLDMLAQVGAPGTLILLFAVLVWPIQRLLGGIDHPVRVLGATMLFFCLGHNFTESSLFDRDALGQVFLLFATALLWMAPPARSDADASATRSAAEKARRPT
ncbi:O-antigen ligase family protein [Sphingomonas sp. R86520]|uniref:O-antigen ligase family protein n=1 Tax=Sphingomonas sp. R86520 TaxID=3093859 RepID=UPI0036D30C7E